MLRLKRSDLRMLALFADYRLLGRTDVQLILGGHVDVLGKRLGRLAAKGWLAPLTVRDGTEWGRPAKHYALTGDGATLLRERDMIPAGTADEHLMPPPASRWNHLIMLNHVLIRLAAMSRCVPTLNVNAVSSESALTYRPESQMSLLYERVDLDGSGQLAAFRPDAAFRIGHTDLRRNLLFFLEIDRANESLTSATGSSDSIQSKLSCYQCFFQCQGYKRYADLWRTQFQGFRLLIVTSTQTQMAKIADVVRQHPPSDFVWVTWLGPIIRRGIHQPIWARGGHTDRMQESILGSVADHTDQILLDTKP